MNPRHESTPLSAADRLERRARRRVGMKFGVAVHAVVYLFVNAGLFLLSQSTGGHWAHWPALGWGLGLAIHAFVIFAVLQGDGLRDRLVNAEIERLQARA